MELKEMLVADHAECWEFDDPEMAKRARRFRTRKKLRENLARLVHDRVDNKHGGRA